MDPTPFLRGNAFPGVPGVPYPRAQADDAARLPGDTWAMAQIPAGVRLELAGDARQIEVTYRTQTDDLGYRGPGAGTTFAVWRGGRCVAEEDASLGDASVRLGLGDQEPDEPATVYLPEGMKPEVTGIEALDGTIEPAPRGPRWVAYGDSVLEGWIASGPAYAWPHVVSREHGLDLVNLGYAGAARGEVVSAEHVASLAADVISITHGTNCWTRIPHGVALFTETLIAFIDVVRQEQPATPLLVVSPIVRPDAESTPNRFGATLADLRGAMENVVSDRIAAGDDHLRLVGGRDLVDESMLGDGIHPNDDGHRALASALGSIVATMAERRRGAS